MRITAAKGAKPRSATPQLTEAEQRRDPVVRRRLSEPALRTFFAIARAWGLSATDERALLGWPPSSTFHKNKSGNGGVLSFDSLTRISLVLGIYKALQILYRDPQLADAWISRPNAAFGGQSALERMLAGDLSDLAAVRAHLDAARGGWT